MLMGSANYTRHNLDNYNLETDIRMLAPAQHKTVRAARDLFDRRWNNRDGRHYSLEYVTFADESYLRYWQYRLMELTGWSTF